MTLANLQARLAAGRRHFSPFFVLGDPSAELSVEFAKASVAAGASMLELGIPYRDPCADGPAIQQACARAFAGGIDVDSAIAIVARIAEACPGVPLNHLVYGNLVHARGVARFCRELTDAGASSLLVPDMPLGEDAALRSACEQAGLGLVRLIGPRTASVRIRQSTDGCAMLYVAGVQGVTGAPEPGRGERQALLERATGATSMPLCAGFGIGTAGDVEHALACGASIAVVGSRLARVIAAARTESRPDSHDAIVAAVAAAVWELAAPVRSLSPPSISPRSAKGA